MEHKRKITGVLNISLALFIATAMVLPSLAVPITTNTSDCHCNEKSDDTSYVQQNPESSSSDQDASGVTLEEIRKAIEEHGGTWKADTNPISSKTLEEKRRLLGLKEFPAKGAGEPNLPDKSGKDLPDFFDWRNQSGIDYITPIKNQLQCGSCWAFATVAVIEGKANIYYANPDLDPDLSEQDLVSCFAGTGCNGISTSQFPSLLNYIRSVGIAEETCFPYEGWNAPCSDKCDNWEDNAWNITSWEGIPLVREAIKQAIIDKGPVLTGMEVYNDFFSYHGGIYQHVSGGLAGYHAVTIVGFGVYNNMDYWIVKNSWGTAWGEDGYFRIFAGQCGIDSRFIYAVDRPVGSYLVADAHGPYTGYINEPVQFFGSAYSGTPPYSWYWEFGDGTDATEQSPQHTYILPGVYNATLTVTDNESNSSSHRALVTIDYMKVEANGPYIGLINESLQFTGLVHGGMQPYTWQWDFGDGNTSNKNNPNHTYLVSDRYTITLIVTDNNNVAVTDSTIVSIVSKPGIVPFPLLGDDRLPSITLDDNGRTIVTWTNEQNSTNSQMAIAYSDTPNNPLSWMVREVKANGVERGSSFDTAWIEGPGANDFHGLLGTFIDLSSDRLESYHTHDVLSDPSSWSFRSLPGPGSYSEFKYVCIGDNSWYEDIYYTGLTGPFFMFISLAHGIPNCPCLYHIGFGPTGEMVVALIFYDGQSRLWTAPASHPDIANLNDRFHLTWQYHNATTGKDQIVWKKIIPTIESHIESTPYQAYIAEGSYPAIAAYDTHVAIVYMNGTSVNCAYSDNDGETWNITTIATGAVYPDIEAVEGTFYVAYIDSGNLYLTVSPDGGRTWSGPLMTNDVDGTVVAEENSVAIHHGGITWVDNRADDYDIYWAKLPHIDDFPLTISDLTVFPSTSLVNSSVNITCKVMQGYAAVDMITVAITGPDGFTPINTTMSKVAGTDIYHYTQRYSILGTYAYQVWAHDTSNRSVLSETKYFEIVPQACVDFIMITTSPYGFYEMSNKTVGTDYRITGYASAFNDTSGYVGWIPVHWSVENLGGDAHTDPLFGETSTFCSGTMANSTAIWCADDGVGHTHSVTFTISDMQVYVDNDADPGWYDPTHVKTIQEGINRASVGDTVFVYDGVYTENFEIKKPLNLIGQDRDNTVIAGGGIGDVIVSLGTNRVNISGFTIGNKEKRSQKSSGYDEKNSSFNFTELKKRFLSSLDDVNSPLGENSGVSVGIWMTDSSDCRVTGNIVNAGYFGIVLINSSANMIAENIIKDCSDAGIYLYNSSRNTISENSIVASDTNEWYFAGIRIEDSSNNIVSDNLITGSVYFGILMIHLIDSVIAENTIIGSPLVTEFTENSGIMIYGGETSHDVLITGNTLIRCGGIFVSPDLDVVDWDSLIMVDNTIDGKAIRLYKNMDHVVVPLDTGQVFLVNCTQCTVEHLVLTNVSMGVTLVGSSKCDIRDNILMNVGYGIMVFAPNNQNNISGNRLIDTCRGISINNAVNIDIFKNIITNSPGCTFNQYAIGIYLTGSSHVNISENMVTSRFGIMIQILSNSTVYKNVLMNCGDAIYGDAIYIYDASDIMLLGNTIVDNSRGISLFHSTRNLLLKNTINDNYYGIDLYDCDNIIAENTIQGNQRGMYIRNGVTGNIIYHNNFNNNTENACDDGTNIWDNGYPSGGNYWDNYTGVDVFSGPEQNISGSDGIGDTPYNISGKILPNQDRYPLMNPFIPDTQAPAILGIEATPLVQVQGGSVNVTCTVTDNNGVYMVKVNITGPTGFTPINVTMNRISGTDNYFYESIYGNVGMYEYFIWAVDRSGNSNTSEVQHFEIIPPPLPDLTITDLTAEQISKTTKPTLRLTATIKNIGEGTANVPFQVSFTARIDPTPSNYKPPVISIGNVTIPSLGPGETVEATILWSTQLQGDTTLIASADNTHVIEETNELNNNASLVIQISLLKKSLTTTADVYKRLSEQYTTPSANTIAELAKKALATGAYTNLITYVETMKGIAPLQQKVGKELEEQVSPKLLQKYQSAAESLNVLIKKALDDGIISWDEAAAVAVQQLNICKVVEEILKEPFLPKDVL